jgi:hypothetical protein
MASAIELHDGSGVAIKAAVTGVLFAYGTSTPASGAIGYAKGCMFSNQTDGLIYRNDGTSASADFVAMADA